MKQTDVVKVPWLGAEEVPVRWPDAEEEQVSAGTK